MRGIQETDTCYSTVTGPLARVFNTDGKKRDVLDLDECRKALDFDIVKNPSFDESGRKIPGHYHLERRDNHAFIPSSGVGERFTPVQHHSVFDYIINDIKPKIPDMKFETIGTLHGCGTGFITATIGDGFRITGDDSKQEMRLMFSNPCNGYGSLVIGFTNVRVLCQNQIAVARRMAGRNGFSIHHTKNAELQIDHALKVISASVNAAKEVKLKSEIMAETNITTATIREMLDRFYPYRFGHDSPGYARTENKRAEVLAQFDGGETAMSIKGDTAWKLFNAFTFPIFNPPKVTRSMDMAEIAYTGALGHKADLVGTIFNAIYNQVKLAA